jgi:hypothetical protein
MEGAAGTAQRRLTPGGSPARAINVIDMEEVAAQRLVDQAKHAGNTYFETIVSFRCGRTAASGLRRCGPQQRTQAAQQTAPWFDHQNSDAEVEGYYRPLRRPIAQGIKGIV